MPADIWIYYYGIMRENHELVNKAITIWKHLAAEYPHVGEYRVFLENAQAMLEDM